MQTITSKPLTLSDSLDPKVQLLANYLLTEGTGELSSSPGNLNAYTDNTIIVYQSASGDWQRGGPTTPISFAATTAGGTQVQDPLGCALNTIYNFFIEVSYTYNGLQFNQLIPYAAAVVTS